MCIGAAATNKSNRLTPSGPRAGAPPARQGATQAWIAALAAVGDAGRDPAMTLPAIIAEAATRFGDAPALLSERESLSFHTLADRMNRYAQWALAQNIRPGDVVALLMPNRPEYFAIWLGVTRIGGVVALLNTNLRGGALAHCIAVAGARHIIVADELACACASALPHMTEAPTLWLHGAANLPGARIDAFVDALGAAPVAAPASAARQDDRALCIYTSGTTGLPKAAHVSHRRIVAWSCWFAALGGFGADDRMYNCLPMYHSVGGVVAIASALINGGSVFIAPKFSARRFWRDVAQWDCTVFQYIGELCRYLVNAPEAPAAGAHRLRLACGNGLGAGVWTAFQERFAIPRILEFYAATESNFSLFNVEGKVGAVGRIPGFMRLRDPVALVRVGGDDNHPRRGEDGFCIRCGADEPGEAIGRIGDASDPMSRFEGYTDAEASEKKILRDVFKPGDAWMRSGDLMRVDSEGFYYFIDRLGDTFRWKGENVAAQEVAEVLCACPGVEEAAVYGVSVPGAEGRAGMAWLSAGSALDLANLARRLDVLPAYARPLFLRVAPSLEVSATFKHRKGEMARQGYDPRGIGDALYVYERSEASYVPLDRARFAAIQSGDMIL